MAAVHSRNAYLILTFKSIDPRTVEDKIKYLPAWRPAYLGPPIPPARGPTNSRLAKIIAVHFLAVHRVRGEPLTVAMLHSPHQTRVCGRSAGNSESIYQIFTQFACPLDDLAPTRILPALAGYVATTPIAAAL